MYNPFVVNLIMDQLTSELSGGLQFKYSSFIIVGAVPSGQTTGDITQNQKIDAVDSITADPELPRCSVTVPT
jgi:hypothetical protein